VENKKKEGKGESAMKSKRILEKRDKSMTKK